MTASRADLADLPFWPRRLRREQAAAYLGVSPATFDAKVADGTVPPPIRHWKPILVWDRAQLDRACDIEAGLDSSGDAPSGSFRERWRTALDAGENARRQ